MENFEVNAESAKNGSPTKRAFSRASQICAREVRAPGIAVDLK